MPMAHLNKAARFLIALIILVMYVGGCGDDTKTTETIFKDGREAMNDGDFVKAINIFRDGLTTDPSNRDFLLQTGIAFKKLDIFDSSIVYFRRGNILYGSDRDFNKNLVDLCPLFGDYSGAITAIATLVRLGDNERMYWYQLAELYYLNRELTMAIKYYKLLIDENPERASIYMKLANSYSELEKYRDAVSVLNNLIKNLGPTTEVYANLGLNYVALKDNQKAEDAFRNSLAIKSGNVPVWINLANILSSSTDRYKRIEALEIFREYRNQVPLAYRLDSIIPALEQELGLN